MCEDAGCETHIGVQTEPGSHAHRQVGEETHQEGREGSDGGGRGDEVSVYVLYAGEVDLVGDAQVGSGTYTCPTGVREDRGVD